MLVNYLVQSFTKMPLTAKAQRYLLDVVTDKLILDRAIPVNYLAICPVSMPSLGGTIHWSVGNVFGIFISNVLAGIFDWFRLGLSIVLFVKPLQVFVCFG